MQITKYTYLIIYLVSMARLGSAQPQIPNNGFEDWAITDTIPPINPIDPIGWTTSNFLMNAGGSQTVFRTEDAVEGNYAILLISDTSVVSPPFGNGLLDTIGGFVALGIVNQINVGGIEYTDRPDSMSVWIKGTVIPGDTSSIGAILTRYNPDTQNNDTIAISARIGMTSTDTVYKKIVVPFNYTSTNSPDLLVFRINVGGRQNSEIFPGNELFLDDIQLLGTSTSTQSIPIIEQAVKVMPNPFSDQTLIEFENPSNEELCFILTNSNGQVVRKIQNISGSQLILYRENLPTGIYFFTFYNRNELIYNGKLIINKN